MAEGKKYGLLLIFTLLLSGALHLKAQTGTIRGKVTTSGTGSPVLFLTIVANDDANYVTTTDSVGRYEFQVPAGTVQLRFKAVEVKDTVIRVTVEEGKTKTLNVQVVSKAELKTVTVENWGSTVTTMDPRRFEFIPGDFDIGSRLKGMIGTSSSNELSTGYNVRGGNFDENLVYVNDIEVYRPFLARTGASEGLSFANVDMVKVLEFSPGGFEAKYGDKMSSVLDITYRKPKAFGVSGFASLMGASVTAEGRSKNLLVGWMMGARYKTNQYMLRTLDVQGEYRPRFFDYQVFLNFDFSKRFTMEYLGNIAINDYLVVPQSRETRFGTINEAYSFKVFFDGKEESKFQTLFNAISATWKPSRKLEDSLRLKFIASAYNTTEKEHYTVMGQYYIDQLETDFGDPDFGNVAFNRGIGTLINHGRNDLSATVINAEHKGRWIRKRDQQLLWGLRFQHEEINDKLSEWKYIDSAGYSIPQGNMSIVELQDVVKNKIFLSSNRAMAYVEYIWTKKLKDTSDLSFTAGIRSNYWTLNNDNIISPRATAAWRPHWNKLGMNVLVFKAAVGFYYQPPFYREFRDFTGKLNYNIEAQQSIHYTFTADYNLKIWKRDFKMIGALYYKQLNNLIPYEIDNVRIRYYAKNNAKGYATGFDFRLNGEFVKDIESWVSFSVMQTKEDLKDDFYYRYYDSLGNPWYPGYSVVPVSDSVRHEPGYIPRPTDQRVSVSVFFQDYLKNLKTCKVHMLNTFGSSLPFGPPTRDRVSDTLRMPAFWRVDIGFSLLLRKEMTKEEEENLQVKRKMSWLKSAWISFEVLNLIARQNTVSYLWVKDVTNRTYAIPNYLTNRQVNLKLQVRF